MSLLQVFDVLIVYNSDSADSPSDLSPSSITPFPIGSDNEACNSAYAYFLKECAKRNLRAGFCTSNDIIGPGTCNSYWTYTDKEAWQKHHVACLSYQIFDRFSPKNSAALSQRQLLFSSSKIKSFNSYSLFKLFFDKQKMYDRLAKYAIPTVRITDNSVSGISKCHNSLKQLIDDSDWPADFTQEIILKDCYGAGGSQIYKIQADDLHAMHKIVSSHKQISFIMQPLVRFDRGYIHLHKPVAADIRLIFLNGKIVSTFIRVAKKNDFRCNQHQGATLAYIALTEIPLMVIKYAREIAQILNKKKSLYTLDFLVANSGHVYFLEGNTGPGLSWDELDKADKVNSQKLIRHICQSLVDRVSIGSTIQSHLLHQQDFFKFEFLNKSLSV